MVRLSSEILGDFSAIKTAEINQLLNIVAEFSHTPPQFWDSILPLAHEKLTTPLQRAYFFNICVKLNRPNQYSPDISAASLFELSILASAATKAKIPLLKEKIALETMERIDEPCDNAAIASLLSCFKDHPLQEALVQKAIMQLDQQPWSPQNLCAIANSLRHYPESPLFPAVLRKLQEEEDCSFDAKATSLLLNAFALVKNSDASSMVSARLAPSHDVAHILLRNPPQWNISRDIGLALNALAQMAWNPQTNNAVQGLCDAFMKCEWTPRDLANVLDALSRMEFTHTELLEEAKIYIPSNIASIHHCRDVSALFVAFGRLRIRDVPLFLLLSHAVERHLNEYSLRQLGEITTAFARLEIRDTTFLQLLSEYLCDQKISSEEALTFLASLGRLRIAHPKLMDHLEVASNSRSPRAMPKKWLSPSRACRGITIAYFLVSTISRWIAASLNYFAP